MSLLRKLLLGVAILVACVASLFVGFVVGIDKGVQNEQHLLRAEQCQSFGGTLDVADICIDKSHRVIDQTDPQSRPR